jgi:D-alanine-D-alanine ligase-like ATP-grasp enzyme
MDAHIPEKWRLTQFVDQGDTDPETYPVFMKPEWGQNSQGVSRVDNLSELQQHRSQRSESGPRYLIQAAAKGLREFEIFYIPGAKTDYSSAIISVTETCNNSGDTMPVNGIYNRNTYYQSCMPQLNAQQVKKIESLFSAIGEFRIARYCARANSLEALLDGQFSIVEINVYVPMPLILLTEKMDFKAKLKFIIPSMKQLALVTKDIPDSQAVKSVFFQKLQCARLLKSSTKNELS